MIPHDKSADIVYLCKKGSTALEGNIRIKQFILHNTAPQDPSSQVL